MNTESKRTGYILLVISMLIFGSLGLFRRSIPISSASLAFVRGLTGSAFLMLIVKRKGARVFHDIDRRSLLLLALTGALMGINWLLLFEAYNYTTVANATLCYYMEPTIVMALSPLFFREKLGLRKLFCILAALIGMSLVAGISGSASETADYKGILFGLLAAVFYSAVVILNKSVYIKDTYEKTIIQLLSASLIMIPYLLITGNGTGTAVFPTIRTVLLILVVGVVHTGLGFLLYFEGITFLPSQSVALLSYLDPVSALFLSALILREPMSLRSVAGAVMIIGAALASEGAAGKGIAYIRSRRHAGARQGTRKTGKRAPAAKL